MFKKCVDSPYCCWYNYQCQQGKKPGVYVGCLVFSYIFITGVRSRFVDAMPPFLTPGDGRSRAQGTDLPRRWVEKWQQRHFGFLYETKRLHLQSFFIADECQLNTWKFQVYTYYYGRIICIKRFDMLLTKIWTCWHHWRQNCRWSYSYHYEQLCLRDVVSTGNRACWPHGNWNTGSRQTGWPVLLSNERSCCFPDIHKEWSLWELPIIRYRRN